MMEKRKWLIVAACFLMVFITLGFCSSNKGLYLSAITSALGIRRSLFSINDSIRFIVSAITSFFFGSLIRRFGPRKLIAAGFLSLILSVTLYSVSDSIPGFYLGGALLGFGLAFTTTSMVGYIIGKWCPENRGTIMGFVLAANGLGGAIAAQIVSPIIYEEGNAFGYRSAYHLVAVIVAAAGVIAVSIIREPQKEESKPVSAGHGPASDASAGPGSAREAHKPPRKRRGQQWGGIAYEEVKKMPVFYITVLSVFLTGMVLQSVNGVGAAHMRDVGLDSVYVANIWSIHSLVLAAAKFLTGLLYDKKGLRFTIISCQTMTVIAILSMIFVNASPAGKHLALVYSLVSSFALPLETIMLPLIASDLFGEKSYAKIMGILLAFNTTGYAVGSPLTNLVYDKTGSYVPMFYVLVVLMGGVIAIFLAAMKSAAKLRKLYS